MIISISWRNVWRNKLRSSVILAAVCLGMFAGVFSWSLNTGMMKQRIDTIIKTESSNIQIHDSSYLKDPHIAKYIKNGMQVAREIEHLENVEAVTERLIMSGMIMSAEQGTGCQVIGIDPEKESAVTNIFEHISAGKYFEGMKRNPILMGKKMAEKLNLKERSKVVITFQLIDGTITRAQFRVVGIYDITNAMYEEMNVFVRKSDMQKLLNLPEEALHEIAVKVNNHEFENMVQESIKNKFSELDVKVWRDLMPEISVMEGSIDFSMKIFIIIILVGLCLAIINTMLMAVLERIKEIGMLMAIGMNKKKVFKMILFETVFLAFSGTLIGVAIASGISLYLGNNGLDISMGNDVYESMGFNSLIYPDLQMDMIIQVTIMVFIASILSAIFPAIKALKLNPAEAIRSDV